MKNYEGHSTSFMADGFKIIDNNGNVVAEVFSNHFTKHQSSPNARLIAAAPELLKQRDALLAACKAIASLGGNLNDDRLTDRTGPNDAASRGILYCSARELARAAIELCEKE